MRIPRYVPALVFVTAAGVAVTAMVLEARGFNQSARTMPLVVGIPTIVFIVMQIVRDGARVARGDASVGAAGEHEAEHYMQAAVAQTHGEEPAATVEEATEERGGDDRSTTLPRAVGWVLFLALLTWLVGLLLAIPVFMISFMRVFGRERWLTVILYALGTAVVTYLFFAVALEIRLYEGLYGDLLPWPWLAR